MRLQDALESALAYCQKQGICAEISATEETGFSVTARSAAVEKLEHHQEKSFSVTVYDAHRTGSAGSSDFSLASLQTSIDKALAIAKFTEQDLYAGLPLQTDLAFEYPQLDLFHPEFLSPSEAITRAIETESIVLTHPHITQAEVSIGSYQSQRGIANTAGFIGFLSSTAHHLSAEALAKQGNVMQRDDEYTIARAAADLLDYRVLAKQVAIKAARRLGAKKIKTQKCPVIFSADLARGLFGSFIHAISGGQLYRGTTFLKDSLGKAVFPSFLQMQQKPHTKRSISSRPFDSEGVKTVERFYVKDGIVESYLTGAYSARKLGIANTGNAGGVYHLEVSSGNQDLAALCRTMQRGLLVTELMGQGVALMTGDYSRGAFGYWVENGEIQYPVDEITIAGNLGQMFQQILAVGSDQDTRGSIITGSVFIENMMVAGN